MFPLADLPVELRRSVVRAMPDREVLAFSATSRWGRELAGEEIEDRDMPLAPLLREVLAAAADTARAAVLGGPPAGPFRWGEADPEPVLDHADWTWKRWKRNASWRPDLDSPLVDAMRAVYSPADPSDPLFRPWYPYTAAEPRHEYAVVDSEEAEHMVPMLYAGELDELDQLESRCWVRWAETRVPARGLPSMDVAVRASGFAAFSTVFGRSDEVFARDLLVLTVRCGDVPLGAVSVDVYDSSDDDEEEEVFLLGGGDDDRGRVVLSRTFSPGAPSFELAPLAAEVSSALADVRLPLCEIGADLARRRSASMS